MRRWKPYRSQSVTEIVQQEMRERRAAGKETSAARPTRFLFQLMIVIREKATDQVTHTLTSRYAGTESELHEHLRSLEAHYAKDRSPAASVTIEITSREVL